MDVAEHRIRVGDDVDLRCLEWRTASESDPPLLFVAGWITIADSWSEVMVRLAETRRVLYLETREKPSAAIPRRLMRAETFGLDRLGRDIGRVVEHFELDPKNTVLVGSSLGANAILEALKQGCRCRAAFLIGPNARFDFPLWSRPLIHLPPVAYRSLVPFMLWYLRNFRLDPQSEPEQYERYQKTLRAADYRRLKLSALSLVGVDIMDGLDRITDPVAVAFAAADRLHGEVNARRLAEALPRGTALPCASNAAMHRPEVIAEIDRYVRMVQ